MLASDSPTYLLRISGPLTIFGSLAFSILPICLAISVLPQPGGPKSRMPFTCLQPVEETASLQQTLLKPHYPQPMHLSNAFYHDYKHQHEWTVLVNGCFLEDSTKTESKDSAYPSAPRCLEERLEMRRLCGRYLRTPCLDHRCPFSRSSIQG